MLILIPVMISNDIIHPNILHRERKQIISKSKRVFSREDSVKHVTTWLKSECIDHYALSAIRRISFFALDFVVRGTEMVKMNGKAAHMEKGTLG